MPLYSVFIKSNGSSKKLVQTKTLELRLRKPNKKFNKCFNLFEYQKPIYFTPLYLITVKNYIFFEVTAR